MASWSAYLKIFIYISLLLFMVSIKIREPNHLDLQFREYLKRFNKTYPDPRIYQNRLEAFKKSLDVINRLNANRSNNSAHYGLTRYSDWLPFHFLNNLRVNATHKKPRYYTNHRHHKRRTGVKKIDWRQRKAVTKVNDQGECGACWAYSAVETIESMNAIKTHTLQEFSVQEVIDCAENSKGCGGGDVCNFLSWMKSSNFTVRKKSDYVSKNCKNVADGGVELHSFICDRFVGGEGAMLKLLSENGPLSVAVNARTWQNYIGGVIEYHCDGDPTKLNHAVQIVGYDLTAAIPHYIVRNSWGEDFGDKGYLYVAVGQNMCGIANEVAALKDRNDLPVVPQFIKKNNS